MTFQRFIQQKQFNRSPRQVSHSGNPGCELTTPTPVAWIEIFKRRLSLWQQQPKLLQPPGLPAVPPAAHADCARHIAEAHALSFPSVLARQSGRCRDLVRTYSIVDMVGHLCIALNNRQQLVTAKTLFCQKEGSPCHRQRRPSERQERRTCSDTIEETEETSFRRNLCAEEEVCSFLQRVLVVPRHTRSCTLCHLSHAKIQCVHVWCSRMTLHSVNVF